MPGSESELLAGFERHLRLEKRASPHTSQAYLADVRAFVSYLEQSGEGLLAAGRVEIQAFLGQESARLSTRSLARRLGSLRAFYAFAARRLGSTSNPARAVRMPKLQENFPLVVSPEVIERAILAASSEAPGRPRASAQAKRDVALIELLYGSGLRVSEAADLTLSQIDISAASLRVLGKGQKERKVPLGGPASRALSAYLEVRGELAHPKTGSMHPTLVFLSSRGTRFSPRRIQELVGRLGRVAAGRGDLHPHALRHSCATHMLEGGADLRSIQDFLGHESLSTTERYTHVSSSDLARVYDRTHPLARLKVL